MTSETSTVNIAQGASLGARTWLGAATLLAIASTAWANTGSTNGGSLNTGSANTGSANTGSANTGSANTGSANTGSANTGPARNPSTTAASSGAAPSEGAPRAHPLDQTSDFWREIREPGYARARRLVDEGIEFLLLRQDDVLFAEAHLRSAILRYERALAILPHDREALYFLGYAMTRLEITDSESGHVQRHDREAIAAFERLNAVDSTYRAEEVGFELGLLYSRVGNNAASIAAYERSIAYALSENQTAITYSNLAETRMQSGDLLGAVRDYGRAIVIAQRAGASPSTLGLPRFGLAVALDRLGETSEAQQRAREAVESAGGTLDHLHQEGVFFEPAAEIHYYEALGHWAIAEQQTGDERLSERRASLRSWQRYLQLATDDDPWRQLVVERERTAREIVERARTSNRP